MKRQISLAYTHTHTLCYKYTTGRDTLKQYITTQQEQQYSRSQKLNAMHLNTQMKTFVLWKLENGAKMCSRKMLQNKITFGAHKHNARTQTCTWMSLFHTPALAYTHTHTPKTTTYFVHFVLSLGAQLFKKSFLSAFRVLTYLVEYTHNELSSMV